jgi:hypothetical protein
VPSALLGGDSVVLSAEGAIPAKDFVAGNGIIGIDRHGRPSFRDVLISQADRPSRTAVLGSSAAFAVMSEHTRVLLTDGTSRAVGGIVIDGDVSDCRFENHVEFPAGLQSNDALNALWNELAAMSATDGSGAIALRCRERDRSIKLPSGIRVAEAGRHSYCVVEKQTLARAIRRDWIQTVVAIVDSWCYVEEEDRIEIERTVPFVLCSYLAALAALSKAYTVEFDSLQHSAYVFVSTSAVVPAVFSKGRTAFLADVQQSALRLEWHDSSWNPVVSGFLISPGE